MRDLEKVIFRIATSGGSHLCRNKNGHSGGAPTMGEIQSDSRPPLVLRRLLIPPFGVSAISRKYFPESSHPTGRICGRKTAIPGAPSVGGIQYDFRPPLVPRLLAYHVCVFAQCCGSNSLNHHNRRAAFVVKNGHSEGDPASGATQSDLSPPLIRRIFIFPFLRLARS